MPVGAAQKGERFEAIELESPIAASANPARLLHELRAFGLLSSCRRAPAVDPLNIDVLYGFARSGIDNPACDLWRNVLQWRPAAHQHCHAKEPTTFHPVSDGGL